ncbi:thiamine diphosphokinase [Dysgonomonas sp. 25]|uniref:thiamine diphosphokinase n=1 Tax=Dysgonomonas sp. 25 TaxID=2302933 RepID=UPI0013D89527|nr:thiamine diphosphokinase [Dysgonomonas sp. 25]NDV67290.1 thiamine diphosphokinase [Dysgonomonas sp. 25]
MKRYKLPVQGQHSETVILANGDFPCHPIPLSILKGAQYIVCCDGATDSLVRAGIVPDAIVGDCDSLSDENKERFAHIIHRIREQDTNDLTKAVNYCIGIGRKKITILGATGKREDHTLGNISLLCQYMQHTDVEMITDYGSFIGTNTDGLYESYPKQQVSFFCLDRCHITTHGLVYPVQNQIFDSWWQGTLNEAITDEFGIDTDGRIVVYRAF